MQIHLPRDLEATSVRVTLEDGRHVTINGGGNVYVTTHDAGPEEYSLTLPTVEFVATHCDNKSGDDLGHGHATIEVEHRH